jgi:hypothetical protein
MGTNPSNLLYTAWTWTGSVLCSNRWQKTKPKPKQQCAKMCFKDPMKSKPIAGGFFVQRIGKEKACWSFFGQNGVSINMVAVQLRAAGQTNLPNHFQVSDHGARRIASFTKQNSTIIHAASTIKSFTK